MSKKNLDINAADRFFSNNHEQNIHYAQQKQSPTKKKGQKLPRINIAFTHTNLDYLQRISKLEDTSITQYVNDLIHEDLKDRIKGLEKAEEVFDKAKEILEKS